MRHSATENLGNLPPSQSPMTPAHPLRVAVFGVGAVGGYFGGTLARAGHEVTFIARGDTAAALRRRGMRVEGASGDFLAHPARVVEDPSGVGPVDLVILGVKAWQVAEVAPMLAPMLGEDSAVLPLQNGVEAADQLAEVLGRGHVLGGLCRIFCFQVGPAHVRHAGAAPWVGLGELDNRASERVESVRRAFEAAGVAAEIPEDIHAAIWSKFVFVTAVGGGGAAERVSIGELRTEPRTRQLLIDSMKEIETLARRLGVDLADDVISSTMDFVDSLPADSTASMQRDLIEGRPSELEAQLGAVVRLAEAAGLDLPISRALYALLLPLETTCARQAP